MRPTKPRVAAVLATATMAVGVLSASLAGAAGPSVPGTIDGPGPWADEVTSFTQGTAFDGSAVLPGRSNPLASLGASDANNNPATPERSLSLGFDGEVVFRFQNNVCSADPGPDLSIAEVTQTNVNPPYPPERADVYTSLDNVTWTKVATALEGSGTVTFPPSVTFARYVKIVDVSDRSRYASRPAREFPADGYDVDAVRALDTSCTAPYKGYFYCGSSALRLTGALPLEPAKAGSPSAACTTANTQVIGIPSTLGLTAGVVQARTAGNPLTPNGSSSASVANTRVGLNKLAALTIGLVESSAVGTCDGGVPKLTAASSLANVRVGSLPVNIQANGAANVLGLAQLDAGKDTRTPTQLTRRALDLAVPVLGLRVTIAESVVGFVGSPCEQY